MMMCYGEKRKHDDHNELNQVHNEGAVLHLVGIRGILYFNHLLLSMCVWELATMLHNGYSLHSNALHH